MSPESGSVEIRPEQPADAEERVRRSPDWLSDRVLVAAADGRLVGQVVCTRAHLDEAPARPGPGERAPGAAALRDRPRADACGAHPCGDGRRTAGERLVGLLGDPAYDSRFGFCPARELGVVSPDPAYGDAFQALALGDGPHPQGRFRFGAAYEPD